MEALITELTRYMNESWARGNRVISIVGVREIIKRHSDGAEGSYRRFPTTDEHLIYRNAKKSQNGNMSVTTH
jgi:hypothetical protein